MFKLDSYFDEAPKYYSLIPKFYREFCREFLFQLHS